MAEKTKAPKPVAPTDKQRAVLDALKGGRSVKVEETNGKKKLTVLGPSGKPVKEQPKLDRSALEGAVKKGWVTLALVGGSHTITEAGTKAKRVKAPVK